MIDELSRQRRLSEKAQRRGWCLEKSAARSAENPSFGTYRLRGLQGKKPVLFQMLTHHRCTKDGFGLSLDDVEQLLH